MTKVEGGRISARQLAGLLVLTRLVLVTMAFPTAAAVQQPQDAWIVAIVGTAITVPFVMLVAYLGIRFPDKTVIEQAELLLGKYLGKLVGMVLIWYWVLVASSTAREVGEAYTVAVMPETPIIVFMVGAVLLAANAARSGLEVVARLGESTMWVVLSLALLVLVLPYDQMNPKNLAPVLARGFRPLIAPIGMIASFYLELIILGMVIPCLTRPRDATRFSLYAVFVSGLVMTWFVVDLAAVFGPCASDIVMPAFSLTRMISIAAFFERIEAVILAAWTLSGVIKLALFLWASAVGLAQLFGVSRYQSFAYPLGAMIVAFGILFYDSNPALQRFLEFENFGIYSFVVIVGTTLVLYATALLRGKLYPGRDRRR
ncbi:MAG: spore germination protein [Firmicutes bacterium]|jgi:spore germination protein KB|nr:spore germination protein [Bacillota bacterium]MDH7496771.1 endospore germination permease [Bacillota bacterium]